MEWSRSSICRLTTPAIITANRHSSAATDFRECISPYTPYRRTSSRNGSTGRETPHPPWTEAAMSPCWRRARTFAPSPTGPSSRACLRPLPPSRSRRGRAHPAEAAACRFAPQEPSDMLGKLTWNAIPWDQPIPLVAGSAVFSIAISVVAGALLKSHLPYLWREWITSVDHKRIGIMYMMLGLVMLVRGFVDAIMMRSQQAFAFHAPGYLPPEHYNQIFSAHGTIMIFFAAMPLMIGLMNFAVPLQLGVRDVAFPTLNSTSFWLSAHVHVLLDSACRQPVDRGGVPDPHRHPRDADPRSLPRLSLLHQRGRGQHDDVYQPDLGLGPSGSLHPGSACFRRLFRGDLHLLAPAAVQLPLHGDGDHGDLPHLLCGLAAPLLHHGGGRQRQCHVWHHHDDHCGGDRREDLQLAVHDVRRPH